MEKREAARRKQAERAAILSRAVENTNEGFVTIGEDHKVVFMNRAAERIFGYSRKEVVGRDLEVILSPGCSQDHQAAVERYLRARRPKVTGHSKELTAVRKDGTTFPCLISFSASRVKGRVFFTGIVRDLTATRALQKQIVQAERLAALGQTVAEIIHEIRNPMVVIGGFVRQLLKRTKEPVTLAKLKVIASEVERVENLLLELRDLYLPRRMRKTTFELQGLLEDVLTLAKSSRRGKNVQLRLESDGVPARVRGDKERLKQVFLNVIRNGIEALEDGGTIVVRSKVVGDRVEVAVTDDGPGMRPEVARKIFEPFFTTKKEGTGLGLCISKRILDEHKGSSLRVTTEPGGGTTVTIGLPLAAKRKRPVSSRPADAPAD